MYESSSMPVSRAIQQGHETAWQLIAGPGACWTGPERIAMVAEARAAVDCDLCKQRSEALSPNAVNGAHSAASDLPEALIDWIHRISTDPGRMTRAVFDGVLATGISEAAYVEATSVVNSSVIVDTMHQALDLPLPVLPEPSAGQPDGEVNEDAIPGQAWVLTQAADNEVSDTGLPAVPNIVRALGLVPSAVALFFTTFRPHYALKDIHLKLPQTQAELIAARVSALNQCFY